MRTFRLFYSCILFLFFVACSTTKNIPEGSYLLDNVSISHDTRNATSDLESFIVQHPNSSLPLFGKFRLKIYNTSGQDTTKWLTRFLRKIGEEPVIYDAKKANRSMHELHQEIINQGYLGASIDTVQKIIKNKIAIAYNIKGKTPYRIRNYTYTIEDSTIARIMKIAPLTPAIALGDYYDMKMLEEERARVNLIMRNAGYFNFSKDLVYFKADSTLNLHQVDLFLNVYPSKDGQPYRRNRIDKVTVVSGVNAQEATDIVQGNDTRRRGRARRDYFRNSDTTEYKDVIIIRGNRNFLRTSSIYKNLYIKKGDRYSDRGISKTYEAFNKMKAIKQVNITTQPSPEDSLKLEATILLAPANAHWLRTSLEATNSAGDLGVAPSISYQHQNLFNGSELFSFKLKGAYEFISSSGSTDLINQSYYEYGAELGLTFPQFTFPWLKAAWRDMPTAQTRFSAGINVQKRPEYTREFFNLTANYAWMSNSNRLTHSVDLLDINYIRMPSISAKFDSAYINNPDNPLLKESYKDQLIARTSYSITLVNKRRFSSLYPTYALRLSSEISGYLPRLAATISNADKDSDGQRRLLGVAYAEYIKGDIDFTRAFHFSKKHSLAYHAGLGIAHPYGNSKVLPFERRYFGGGANGVRGWSTRRLGPGSYQSKVEDNSDFVNQTGDLKLEFSIENRHKLSSLFELAEFIDAGNIWTIKNYDTQPDGQFKFSKFYKEIAVSYGIGLRFDLTFLLLRVDAGVRAYDPGEREGKFVLLKPRMSRTAFHFGIGYPF